MSVVAAPAASQILDATWAGREEAAEYFQNSIDKEHHPPDWMGSIKELEKSVKLSPEPSWEASLPDGSGRWRRHYLPYFYLGRAYWGLGDCQMAVESFSKSLEEGEVCKGKIGEPGELQKKLIKCEQRGIAPPQPARDLVRSECSKIHISQPLGKAGAGGRHISRELIAKVRLAEDLWSNLPAVFFHETSRR